MRQINDFEKEILNRIITFYNRGIVPNLASVIEPYLENKEIYIDFVANLAEIRADAQYYNQESLVDEVRTMTLRIVTVVMLIKYLQDNGFITIFNETTNTPTQERYGQLIQGNTCLTAAIADTNVKNLLIDYSFKSILLGQALIDFVSNDFRTKEQVDSDKDTSINKRNLKIAVIALIASTIIGVIGLIFSFFEVKYCRLQIEQQQNVLLNKVQYKVFETQNDSACVLVRKPTEKVQEFDKLYLNKIK